MRVWMYERGEWAEIPSPFTEGEELEQAVARLEFGDTPILLLGDPDGFHVEVYAAERTAAVMDAFGGRVAEAEFLASVDTWSTYYPVFIADLPSLVQLMGELRPILASEREALDFERRGEKTRTGPGAA